MDFANMDNKDKLKLGLAIGGIVIALGIIAWFVTGSGVPSTTNDNTPRSPQADDPPDPNAPVGGRRTAPEGTP